MATTRKRFHQSDRPDDLDEWVGPPALMNAENEKKFSKLRADIEAEIAPQNVFDEIAVFDISHKIFEEQELRGLQTKIIASARVASLTALLTPSYGQNIDKAAKVAQDYFGGAAAVQQAAKKRVSDLGISMEDINANALHLRMASIQTLDDMIDRRENGRNRIIKRHRKRELKNETEEHPSAADRRENSRAPKQATTRRTAKL
jgi:hypothetical protein